MMSSFTATFTRGFCSPSIFATLQTISLQFTHLIKLVNSRADSLETVCWYTTKLEHSIEDLSMVDLQESFHHLFNLVNVIWPPGTAVDLTHFCFR